MLNIRIYSKNKAYTYHAQQSPEAIISNIKYINEQGRLRVNGVTNHVLDIDSLKTVMQEWYGMKNEETAISKFAKPIKLYTYLQTGFFLMSSPLNFFFGAGIGNFSSKLALKTTGLNLQGTYPVKYIYLNESFIRYHLYSTLYVFSLPVSEHSVINFPNSIYNQVTGEYGIIGLILFGFCYVGYFIKRRKKMEAGKYILLISLMFFSFEYWFEMLSFTVIFEFLMFADIFKTGHD